MSANFYQRYVLEKKVWVNWTSFIKQRMNRTWGFQNRKQFSVRRVFWNMTTVASYTSRPEHAESECHRSSPHRRQCSQWNGRGDVWSRPHITQATFGCWVLQRRVISGLFRSSQKVQSLTIAGKTDHFSPPVTGICPSCQAFWYYNITKHNVSVPEVTPEILISVTIPCSKNIHFSGCGFVKQKHFVFPRNQCTEVWCEEIRLDQQLSRF